MLKTDPIYLKEPYRREIEAAVLSVFGNGNGWSIVLDRTIFYPEGGGQPGDRGEIGSVPIVNTVKREGMILHQCEDEPELRTGQAVLCRLDWMHRCDFMQQHSGQHILSGALHTLFGIGTLSVHQGDSYLAIETDRAEISAEEIAAVEACANRVISEGATVESLQADENQIEAMNLRREPKVSGTIRLIRVGSFDTAACGGIHVANSREVRLAAWVGQETIRGHVRLFWKIGDRALRDYREKTEVTRRLTELYSVPLEGIAAQAEARIFQYAALRQDYSDLEQNYARLLLESLAARPAFGDEGESGLQRGPIVIAADLSAEKIGLPALLAKQLEKLAERFDRPILFCGVQIVADDDLRWTIASAGDVTIDFSLIKQRLLPVIEGKGGGKPPVWQGKGSLALQAEPFLQLFTEIHSGRFGGEHGGS